MGVCLGRDFLIFARRALNFKRFSLVGAKKRGLAGRGARCQSFGAFSVATQYPIPHDLQRHAPDPRGITAATTFKYCRYRQQPTD